MFPGTMPPGRLGTELTKPPEPMVAGLAPLKSPPRMASVGTHDRTKPVSSLCL